MLNKSLAKIYLSPLMCKVSDSYRQYMPISAKQKLCSGKIIQLGMDKYSIIIADSLQFVNDSLKQQGSRKLGLLLFGRSIFVDGYDLATKDFGNVH